MKHKFFGKIPAFLAVAIALAAGVPSCISIGPDKPANIKYFVLSSDANDSSAKPTVEKIYPKIPFAKISIPAYLDIPQIVTRNGNEIIRDEQNRWGESLARAVSRELGARTAAAFAARKDARPAMLENKRILVSVDRFDGTLDGNVVLEASFEISLQDISRNTPNVKISQHFKTSVPVEPNDTAGYVRALDKALTELAAAIAQAIQ